MSINAQLAQGTTFFISGSSSTPEDLTAIQTGYPTILSITGHAGVANGDYITLANFTGTDAALLNGKSFVATHYATGATNDTIAIDVDTTGKTITIGIATATPAAWTEITEIKGIKPSGASASKIDVTDLKSTAKEYRTGLVDNGTFSLDVNILESDAGQTACLAAFKASTVNAYKVVYPSGKTRTFNASCLKWPTVPDSSVDGVQTGTSEFQISGAVTVSP